MFMDGWIAGVKEVPMRKMIASLVLAAFVTVPGPASGQEKRVSRPSVAGLQVGCYARLSYPEITLTLRDGTVILGRLIGADTDSVRVLQDGPYLDVLFRDIKKAVLTVEGKASRGMLPGVAMGFFLGTGLLTGSFSHPGNYMRRLSVGAEYTGFALLYLGLIESAAAALGGSLGAFVASGTSHKSFEFPGDPERNLASRDRFLRFIGGEPAPSRVHLLIQGGWVLPGVSRSFDSALVEAGFTPRHYEDLSRFSILRGFELSYSFKPRWRAGVRISFPSEPEQMGYLEGPSRDWTRISQTFRATAIHAVGSFEPLRRDPSGAVSWSIGLGVGVVPIRLRRGMSAHRDGDYITNEAETRKTLPSGVVFTALEFRMNEIFTAGVAADYTVMLAATVPGLPDLGLAARKVGLGNASIGFILGYHF